MTPKIATRDQKVISATFLHQYLGKLFNFQHTTQVHETGQKRETAGHTDTQTLQTNHPIEN